MKRNIMIQTFEQFNKLYEGDNQERIDNKENDNIIKDVILYNDFPKDEDKPNRSWEETIQIIRNSKYNVRCVLLSLDKYTRYDWSSPYEFEYKNKIYRYNKSIHREESIIDEIERINKIAKPVYKKICICEGAIEYTILYKSRKQTYLIIPLNKDGEKIKRANVEILSPKYLLRIEKDILDGYDYDIETSVKDRYINKILAATSKKDIDIILSDAFKVTTQEIYSIIFAYSLCREIEYEIWDPTELNNEEIINALGERFGFDYFKKE